MKYKDPEHILLTLLCINYFILNHLEDDVIRRWHSTGKHADAEEVLGIDLEYDEAVASGWEYGVGF